MDTKISELHWNDNLLYHYAGGVAFGALKRWREAEEFFEICVTAPAQTAAAIQLEALKKLTLVQLILYGKVSLYPLRVSTRFSRLRAAHVATKVHQPDSHPESQDVSVPCFRQELPADENGVIRRHRQGHRAV